MKTTRIALLSSIIAAVSLTVVTTAKASTIGYLFDPSVATDNRFCAFYTDNESGQWWAIDRHDDNYSDQLALLVAAKANGWQVDIYQVGSVCGSPRANAFPH